MRLRHVDDPNEDSTEAFGLVGLILGLIAIGVALHPLIWPPFTDEDLSSLVDSWEPAAFIGLLMLVMMAAGALLSLVFALCSKALTRTLFQLALAAFCVAMALQVASLNVLTDRVESAVGHDLHWWPL